MAMARRFLYDTADGVRLEALADSSHAPLAELVGKIRREERYHVMHATTWVERLAWAGGEARERLVAAVLERLGREPGNAPLRYFVRLATLHEDMHAEAFHYTRHTLGYEDPFPGEPWFPAGTAPDPGDAAPARIQASAMRRHARVMVLLAMRMLVLAGSSPCAGTGWLTPPAGASATTLRQDLSPAARAGVSRARPRRNWPSSR